MNRRTFLKGLGISAAMAGAGAFQKKGARAEKGEQVWRMVTSWSKILPILQNGAERFAENLAIMSGGRLKIQVYAGGELVKPLEVFDAVSSGTVECGNAASYYWAKKVPAAQWFTTVPFGLKASELNTWLHKGGGLELWREVYAPHNVIPMPAGNTGILCIHSRGCGLLVCNRVEHTCKRLLRSCNLLFSVLPQASRQEHPDRMLRHRMPCKGLCRCN